MHLTDRVLQSWVRDSYVTETDDDERARPLPRGDPSRRSRTGGSTMNSDQQETSLRELYSPLPPLAEEKSSGLPTLRRSSSFKAAKDDLHGHPDKLSAPPVKYRTTKGLK